MKRRNFAEAFDRKSGFTLTEFIVCLVIIAVLILLAMPATTGTPLKGRMTQPLSNMKQLHLATLVIALDGSTTGDTNLGWPGKGVGKGERGRAWGKGKGVGHGFLIFCYKVFSV